ncbi:hypothetical protein CM240_3185 [Clostridium bornimense]|uniref:Uncharacterized protein n=1 Tax=Clostridium bornimense TaxID=1216932 RepID=W6S7B5_9CLOT|nr:hypothetical protein [Clostridium bornimense]CDM70302.1 hypothetical protein CM240_3185 [Clostridium bornimense]
MININKESELSLKIEFDEEGSKGLIKVLEDTIHMKNGIIEVNNKVNQDTIGLEFIQDNDMNEIIFGNNKIVIKIDKDEIEYAIERFIESKESKCFYPAEVCECYYKKKYLTVYAELLNGNN